MQTMYSASLPCVVLLGCVSSRPRPLQARSTPEEPARASTGAARGVTASATMRRIDFKTPSGKAISLDVVVDDNVAADSADGVEVIAEVGPSLVIVDNYLSAPGAMSYCQAGRERFLRIVTLGPKHPEEILRLKLESCWQHIELEDLVKWSSESSTLQISWLFGPLARNPPEELTLHVGSVP